VKAHTLPDTAESVASPRVMYFRIHSPSGALAFFVCGAHGFSHALCVGGGYNA
jgi:hypothetical protein